MTEGADKKAASAVAITASGAALACGICCVLPFALPAALLGTFGGVLAIFASAYRWLTPIAVFAVASGWLWVLHQSRSTRRRQARPTLSVMTLATIAMLLALAWPMFEEPLIAMLR